MMDQNYIALDLDQRHYLHPEGKLGELLRSDPGTILDALRLPDTDETIDRLLEGPYAVQHSPLFRLPPELFEEIFEEIQLSSGTYDTRLALIALTCKALLACARRHIVRLQTRRHAPLAGRRLICIGEGATTPPGLLTPADVNMLTPYGVTHAQADEAQAREVDECVSLFAHAASHWRRHSFQSPATGSVWGLSMSASLADLIYRPSAVSRMSMDDFVRFQSLTTVSSGARAEGTGSSQVSQCALCNLTKGEYVHVDDSDASITLWQMLLACICWTSCRSPEEEASELGKLYKGQWAGDRFAIRTLDVISTERGWSDVTDEVILMVKSLRARACGWAGI